MKKFIISVSFVVAMVFVGCAMFQKPTSEEVKKASVCAAICATSEAAQCWKSRGIEELLGPAMEAYGCYNQCMDNGKVTVDVDLDCIRKAGTCNILEECLSVK